MKKIILSLALAVSLSGCVTLERPEQQVFGVPKGTWESLSDGQKQEVIRGYYQRETAKEQQKTVCAIGSAASSALNCISENR